MELAKKTTILFTPDLHARLMRLAKRRRSSLGSLVREACEIQYGTPGTEERIEAARALRALRLPVGRVAAMKRQSVPDPDDLLP